MIASMGQLVDLRDEPLVVPADDSDAFYRWCHDEWTAIKAYAAALEWDPSVKLEPPATSPTSGAQRRGALVPLTRLRGRPFCLVLGPNGPAFRQWVHHEWAAIKARANALEWRSTTPPPNDGGSPPPPEAPPEAPPATTAVEVRVAALEDEVGRLRSKVAFLDLTLDMEIKRAEEENRSLQLQINELRDLIAQALARPTASDATPAATSNEPPCTTEAAPVAAASDAPCTTETAPAPTSTESETAPEPTSTERLRTTEATPVSNPPPCTSEAPPATWEAPLVTSSDAPRTTEATPAATPAGTSNATALGSDAEADDTHEADDAGDAGEDAPEDAPEDAEETEEAHQANEAPMTPEAQRKVEYLGQLRAENAALRSTHSHLKGLFEGLTHG